MMLTCGNSSPPHPRPVFVIHEGSIAMIRLLRPAIAGLFIGWTCIAATWAAAQEKAVEQQGTVKVLLIGKEPDHPYGSHMYMHTAGVLAKCLALTPGVETVISNGWPKDPAVLAGVRTIVVYTSPGAELLLDGAHRDEVDRLMKRGVGLVTIHWASAIRKENVERLGPTWIGYLGGMWISNVGLSGGKAPLRQLVADHPICRGWSDYEIDDEYYLNPTIDKATPLLLVREATGRETMVGWIHERDGGGRAFATTLGHPYRNFQLEAFRRMIVNAILWSAHVEVPATGAAVNVGEEVLALPPQK
jgi:type 1 glutamine amidotransferase